MMTDVPKRNILSYVYVILKILSNIHVRTTLVSLCSVMVSSISPFTQDYESYLKVLEEVVEKTLLTLQPQKICNGHPSIVTLLSE